MRTIGIIVGSSLILVGGLCLLHGQTRPKDEQPATVHRHCQRLAAQVADVEDGIRQLEHEIQRARKAAANYEYVHERNAALIERLQAWAASE